MRRTTVVMLLTAVLPSILMKVVMLGAMMKGMRMTRRIRVREKEKTYLWWILWFGDSLIYPCDRATPGLIRATNSYFLGAKREQTSVPSPRACSKTG